MLIVDHEISTNRTAGLPSGDVIGGRDFVPVLRCSGNGFGVGWKVGHPVYGTHVVKLIEFGVVSNGPIVCIRIATGFLS